MQVSSSYHLLLFLFFFIVTFYSILKITTIYLNKIYYNNTIIELICTCFSLLFLLFIISPALIILLDLDSIIIPSFIIYNLGYQWAWSYSINYLHSIIGYNSYHDHYMLSTLIISGINYSNVNNDNIINVSKINNDIINNDVINNNLY